MSSKLQSGTRLGGEVVLHELIGEGATAQVWAGEQLSVPGSRVAIKVLRPELAQNDHVASLFEREAASFGQLRDATHVARIFSAGKDESLGLPYFVMEILAESLDEGLSDGAPLSAAETLTLASQLASALEALREQGMVHRDIKCSNIMVRVSREGVREYVLTDFGLSELLTREELHTRVTRDVGQVEGTLAYWAPELFAAGATDKPPFSAATDMYALGVVLYRAVTGEYPFKPVYPGIATAHLQQSPAHPAIRGVPRPLADLVMRLLEKKPGKRPDPVRLKSEVARVRSEIEAAAAPPGVRLRAKLVRLMAWGVLAGFALFMVVILVRQATRPPDLVITTEPPGAEYRLYQGRRLLGQGITPGVESPGQGEYQLTVEKAGFVPVTLSVNGIEPLSGMVLAEAGTLSVLTEPSGAEVLVEFLDGPHNYTQSRWTAEDEEPIAPLPPGLFWLRVSGVAGFVDHTDTIRVEAGTSHYAVRLDPALGYVHVSTFPRGAAIEFDGVQFTEETPLLLGPTPLGEHAVKIVKNGFHSVEESVSLDVPGDTLAIRLVMPPIDADGMVVVAPYEIQNPTVYVDGRRVEGGVLAGIPAGVHRFRIEKDCYLPFEEDVHVPRGGMMLDPSLRPIDVGEFRITVDIDCPTSLWVNGKRETRPAGTDAWTVRLRCGANTLRFACLGEADYDFTKRFNAVVGSEVNWLHVGMYSEVLQARTWAPPANESN